MVSPLQTSWIVTSETFHFLFEMSLFNTPENEQYVFSPQISDTKERIWVGCKLILD